MALKKRVTPDYPGEKPVLLFLLLGVLQVSPISLNGGPGKGPAAQVHARDRHRTRARCAG